MRFLSLLILSLVTMMCDGQNYTFTPGSEVYGVLEMDIYTEHYLYVNHESPDSAHITWRVVENTCPDGWDIQLCDFQHCYTGLPNTGNMSAVAPDGQGYLRVIVNPSTMAGSGMLHFLIFPTGEPLNFQDAYFYFTTTLVDIQTPALLDESFCINSTELIYSGRKFGQIELWNLDGQRMKTERVYPGQNHIAIAEIPAGCYIMRTAEDTIRKIIISH